MTSEHLDGTWWGIHSGCFVHWGASMSPSSHATLSHFWLLLHDNFFSMKTPTCTRSTTKCSSPVELSNCRNQLPWCPSKKPEGACTSCDHRPITKIEPIGLGVECYRTSGGAGGSQWKARNVWRCWRQHVCSVAFSQMQFMEVEELVRNILEYNFPHLSSSIFYQLCALESTTVTFLFEWKWAEESFNRYSHLKWNCHRTWVFVGVLEILHRTKIGVIGRHVGRRPFFVGPC